MEKEQIYKVKKKPNWNLIHMLKKKIRWGGEERGRNIEEEEQKGGRAGLWLLLCRNVNTLQRPQKTMTPQGGEGVHVCVWRTRAHAPAWVGAATAPQGAGRRWSEGGREERERRPEQNEREEISIIKWANRVQLYPDLISTTALWVSAPCWENQPRAFHKILQTCSRL